MADEPHPAHAIGIVTAYAVISALCVIVLLVLAIVIKTLLGPLVNGESNG